ncbi:MAG TPA: hypothetical protein VLE99_06130 [Candidatus Saccharimonadales bacterium]|nr:hypothetical protein [Candidatus Saccharimonadales bacterium]
MLLLAHIVVALTSVLQATFGVLRPSRAKLLTTYGLIAGTLVTGTYLVISLHAPVLQSCVSGLAYLVATLPLAAVAQHRLSQQIEHD